VGREDAVLNDTQRLKCYLAEEMVEDYKEGRMSRRQMIKTVGQILGVAVVSPTLLASLGCGNPEAGVEETEAPPVPQSDDTESVTVEPDDPDIEVSESEDGYVVYDRRRDRVHYLNHTAAVVLELCTGENEASGIAALLCRAYDLPEPPASEIEGCLELLRQEGLVR
jgi:hypothetical protein